MILYDVILLYGVLTIQEFNDKNVTFLTLTPQSKTKVSYADSLRRLTRTQAVWHSDNIFTDSERSWSTLDIEAEEKFSRRQRILRAKG